VLTSCKVEPALAELAPEDKVHFERLGYFCADRFDHQPGKPVFNRTVSLKDTWAKIEQKGSKENAAEAKPASATKPQADADGAGLISMDDFSKLQLKAARVLAAERIPNTDKLLKLTVDCGEQRQIVAGIALHYQPEDLVGKTIIIVNNLQPAVLGGVESQGMLLAAKRKKELRILTVDGEIPPGASVG